MKEEANILSIVPKERIKLCELIPWVSTSTIEFLGKFLVLNPQNRISIADVKCNVGA